jgi:cytosine/adenosine deaminase-related metal-dependent hydrolase
MITVENIPLDLGNLALFPGLINAHDHLEFALFSRLGKGPYPNATRWAHDIHDNNPEFIAANLAVPKHLRLLWGGLRDLLAGVTTVCHHNPYESLFDDHVPVRVVRNYGWAHSLAFEPEIRARFDATPHNAPFLIHAAEGTDEESAQEIFDLDKLGVVTDRTVIIHGVALTEPGLELLRQRRASLIWCPRSNQFLFDRTMNPPRDIPTALGTDSPITAEGDLLDEIAAAQTYASLEQVRAMVTTEAEHILRLPPTTDVIAAPAFAQPPQLVVIQNRIHLIAPHLAEQLPAITRSEFHELHICGRAPVLVRWNIPELIASTRARLSPIHLAGREVLS